MKRRAAAATRGRPRQFDRNEALEKAVMLFGRWGYEGTSIATLTRALGISPPSLYAAFGSKKDLFLEAVERYAAHHFGLSVRPLAEEPTARQAIEHLLADGVAAITASSIARGCLLVSGAINCGPQDSSVEKALRDRRVAAEHAILSRLARGRADGEPGLETDLRSLAKFYATVLHGMSLQARDGAGHAELNAVARLAMKAWPAPPSVAVGLDDRKAGAKASV